jgi:hypothetical protein
MAGARTGTRRSILAASTILCGALVAAVIPAAVAGAAGKTVLVGNGTSVLVPKGWAAGKPTGGKIQLTHEKPKAVLAVETGTGVTASPQTQGQTTFNSFVKGFPLKSVKKTDVQNSAIPGGGKFDEAWSETYTGKYQGKTLGGIVVQLQNSKTGDAVFAIAIAEQKDKPKLKSSVNQIVNSLANN